MSHISFDVFEALEKGDIQGIKNFLDIAEKGILQKKLNEMDSDGNNILMKAVQLQKNEIAKLILNSQLIDLEIENSQGKKALDIAYDQKNYEIIKALGGVALNQEYIIYKLQKYILLQAEKKGIKNYQQTDVNQIISTSSEGLCSGLGGLWLIRMSRDEEPQFIGNLTLISNWDETLDALYDDGENMKRDGFLKNVFEKMINDIRWMHAQNYRLRMAEDIRPENLVKLYELVKPTSTNQEIEKEFSISFNFKKDELTEILHETLNEGKMVRISGLKHTFSVMKLEGKYFFYDPKEIRGVKVFNESEFSKLQEAIQSSALLGTSYNDKKIPMLISVFDKKDNKRHPYKRTAEGWVEYFFKKNNDVNRFLEIETLNADGSKSIQFDQSHVFTMGIFNEPKLLKLILRKNKNAVNTKNSIGNTILHEASALGLSRIVKILIKNNADINQLNNNGQISLMYAAIHGDKDTIYTLLKHPKIKVNTKDTLKGWTALMYAANNGNLSAVKALMKEKNISVNEKDKEGNSALLLAINGDIDNKVKVLIVKELIKKPNIDLGVRNIIGITAIYLAIIQGNRELLKILLTKIGKKINDKVFGDHPLMTAMRVNDPEILKLLLEHQYIDINMGGNIHAFIWALNFHNRSIEVIQSFIDAKQFDPRFCWSEIVSGRHDNNPKILEMLAKGIHLDLQDPWFLLIKAIIKGKKVLAESIIAEKDKNFLNRQAITGKTLVSLAVNYDRLDILQMLLNTNIVDLNCPDIEKDGSVGWTPLMYAAYYGNIEAVKILLQEKDIAINSRDGMGKTALDLAIKGNHKEIVELLLLHEKKEQLIFSKGLVMKQNDSKEENEMKNRQEDSVDRKPKK